MIVAWQFTAWDLFKRRARPVGTVLIATTTGPTFGYDVARVTIRTVPYGTDLLRTAFQAINRLATIIRSLRDTARQTPWDGD
jgi:hypothetical protein